MRRRLVLGLLAAGALAACGRSTDAPRAAQRFPALALPSLAGGTVLLETPLEGPVLVNFWATWCAPCRREMSGLERLSRRMGPALRVVGVSVDEDANLAREWVRRSGLSFLNLSDPGGRATRAVLALATLPETFLVRRDASIAARLSGAREWDDEAMVGALMSAAARA